MSGSVTSVLFSWCMVFLFSIVIGIVVNLIFRQFYPTKCLKCEQHERDNCIKQAVAAAPATFNEESDIED